MLKADSNLSRNILMFLFCLYYAQGSLYAVGSIISQLSLFLVYGISLFYFVKTLLLKEKKSLFYKAWSFLLILNVIGFFFTAQFSNLLQFDMLKRVLGALVGFYPFYYFSYKKKLQPKVIVFFFMTLLPITIAQYFVYQLSIIDTYNVENVVNNVAYLFVGLIPFLFKIRNKLLAISCLLIILYFIIQSSKRGALLAGGIGVLVYLYFIFKSIKYKSKIKLFRAYIAAFGTISFLFYYAYQRIMENEFFLRRLDQMAEGDSSYRTENYMRILEAWFSSESFINLIFGFGFASSLEITGRHFAHNDWLELLSNFGLIGVLLYLFLIGSTYKYLKDKKYSFENRLMLLSIVIIWFLMTMFSMWYTALFTFLQAVLLGYIYGEQARLTKIYKPK